MSPTRMRLLFWTLQLQSVTRGPHAEELVVLLERAQEVLQGLGVSTNKASP